MRRRLRIHRADGWMPLPDRRGKKQQKIKNPQLFAQTKSKVKVMKHEELTGVIKARGMRTRPPKGITANSSVHHCQNTYHK